MQIHEGLFSISPETREKIFILEATSKDAAYFHRMSLEYDGIAVLASGAAFASVLAIRNEYVACAAPLFAGTAGYAINEAKKYNKSVKRLAEIQKQFDFLPKIPDIQRSINKIEPVAYPEFQNLKNRLERTQTIIDKFIPAAFDVSLMRDEERRKTWKTLNPLLDDLSIETSTLSDDARYAEGVFGHPTTLSRPSLLKQEAMRLIDLISDRDDLSENAGKNYDSLQRISSGQGNFNKITLFTINDMGKAIFATK